LDIPSDEVDESIHSHVVVTIVDGRDALLLGGRFPLACRMIIVIIIIIMIIVIIIVIILVTITINIIMIMMIAIMMIIIKFNESILTNSS
jgi:hypothetical protein